MRWIGRRVTERSGKQESENRSSGHVTTRIEPNPLTACTRIANGENGVGAESDQKY